ncbi:uncharacterized protein [Aristolochia californica]|uniref:uncharacterized protein n=1 Tax=Aristolochia californica TaxID=171875 RepID=UPI0035D6861B
MTIGACSWRKPVVGVLLTDAQNTELEGLKLKDLKAKNYLFQVIDHSILETILCKDTTNHIWDSMKKKYQGTTRAKRQQLQALRSKFEMLQMKSGESVTDYFSRTMKITLHPVELIEDKEEAKVEVEEAETTMIVGTNNKIFITKRVNFKEEAKDVESTTQQLDQSRQTSPMLNVSDVIEKEEEVSLLMVCHMKDETQPNMWYLDTGSSNHMCGENETFSDLNESFRSSIKFGDNSTISVMGKGKVTIQTKGNSTYTIANVLFVPDLKTNLLSVGQLQENGAKFLSKMKYVRFKMQSWA